MPTYRMLPPIDVARQTRVVNGRSYTGTPGSTYDVADFDAEVLSANGWIKIALSGPSTARPSATLAPNQVAAGSHYFDSTLGVTIVYDGASWRDPATGNSV